MDTEEFEIWKVCWETNLAFYKPIPSGQQHCIVCSKLNSYPSDTLRSMFWVEATRCSRQHFQITKDDLKKGNHGVCAACDQGFVLNVIKGRQLCRVKDCGRVARVNEAIVRQKLEDCEPKLLERFLEVVKKCRTYECEIHCDDVELGEGLEPLQAPSKECNHDRKVCDDCLRETYERAIRGGRMEDIKCPDTKCQSKLAPTELKKVVRKDVYKIYEKQIAMSAFQKDPKFRWCSCGHPQIHGPGESNPEWICLGCKKRHCFICRDNEGPVCEHLRKADLAKKAEKDRQRKAAQEAFAKKAKDQDNIASQKEILRTTKVCPKAGCPRRIEYTTGCLRMTCKKGCHSDFCWNCKVLFSGPGKAAKHLTSCKFAVSSKVARSALDMSEYKTGWDQDPEYDTKLDQKLWVHGPDV